MPEQQGEFTTEVFDDWSSTDRAEKMASSHDELLHPLFEYLKFDGESNVLDIGCGVGAALLRAHRSGAGSVAGLDLSQGMINKAIQYLPEGSDLQVGSVLSLPWENGSFTHVITVEALYYISDPLKAIREIHRVLGDNGHFSMVIEYYTDNIGTHHWPDSMPMEWTNWSEVQWCDAFATAGFVDVESSRVIREEKPDESAFESNKYFPTYELYKDYLEQGALWVQGVK